MVSPDPRPAAFLDRDGVINVNHEYVGSIERWEWIEGAREAIRHLNQSGYFVFVVTNQSGIARGMYSEADFHVLMDWVRQDLAKAGGHFDAIYFCPHGPDEGCDCRKPRPGMLLQAMREWSVQREGSFLIGDSPTDLEAAEAAGVRGYSFTGGSLSAFVASIIDD